MGCTMSFCGGKGSIMLDEVFAKAVAGGDPVVAELMRESQLGHLYIEGELAPKGDWPLVVEDGRIYLERSHFFETRIADELVRLVRGAVKPLYISAEGTEEQKRAITQSLTQPISLIAGGPGTGKSFTIGQIVKALPEDMRVAIAAPTGKAAMRIGGQTLHALLGIKHPRDFMTKDPHLGADVVIVDECSMIDAAMWSFFLKACPTGTRLILVGDPDQLPPVEAGTIFSELVSFAEKSQPKLLARLTKCLRTDRTDILDLAAAARLGEMIPHETTLPKLDGKAQILSCIKQGPWGVETINELIPPRKQVPIILTRSDPNLRLYNGETGILEGEWATFHERVHISDLPPYKKAYCITVHKSQGSEYDDVILLVPPGSEVFGREMIYTAITRARNSIRVVADTETLRLTLSNRCQRRSFVQERVSRALQHNGQS